MTGLKQQGAVQNAFLAALQGCLETSGPHSYYTEAARCCAEVKVALLQASVHRLTESTDARLTDTAECGANQGVLQGCRQTQASVCAGHRSSRAFTKTGGKA